VSTEPRHRAVDDAASESAVRVVWIYPDLLSTYGDRGNMLILAWRADMRGLPVETIEVRADQAVPEQGDIYLLSGGEDGPQALAAQRLNADRGLHRALERGASLFAVCAGYQLVGRSFYAKGAVHPGLDLLDLTSDRGATRAVGEIAGTPDPGLRLPTITGFENHGGRTHLGPGLKPLARISTGIGNDGTTEGVWDGRILGTYMHGPALARNPAIADLLLSWVIGSTVEPLPDAWPARLRAERLAAVGVS
jgi:CobQ-like glutamine amidotransferase family enzyme